MPSQKPSRIIVDTNIWISFLIGKELQDLKNLIVSEKVKIIMTDQLLTEIRLVTSRNKLKKYFNQGKVSDLISLLDIIADKIKIEKIDKISRDAKDDFLLALAKEGRANYLITGDKDLLDIQVYGQTKILTVKQFKEKIK
jgi:uncharacterized protein